MKKLFWGFFTVVTVPLSVIIVAKVWAAKQNKKGNQQEEIILTKKINSKEEVEDNDKNSIQNNQTESGADVMIIKNNTEIKPVACDFIVIDIETTGLSSKHHKITEIAAIKVKDGQIIETFQTLIKPYQRPGEHRYQNQEYLSNKITELTGITEDMLSTAPNIESVLREFRLFISDQLLVGHNISFDLGFLKRDFMLFLNYALTNSVVDTLVLSRDTLSISNHRLGTLARYFNVQIEGSHRALADCKTTLEVYKGLLEKQPQPEKKNLTEAEIKTQAKKFTASHPLYAKKCVCTSLSTMTLRSVKELLEELGGTAQDNITKSTEILILGSRESAEKPSTKHKKALEYMAKGQAIQILDEFDFFEILLKNDEE